MKQEILEKGRRHSLRPTVMTQATVNGAQPSPNCYDTSYGERGFYFYNVKYQGLVFENGKFFKQ